MIHPGQLRVISVRHDQAGALRAWKLHTLDDVKLPSILLMKDVLVVVLTPSAHITNFAPIYNYMGGYTTFAVCSRGQLFVARRDIFLCATQAVE